MSDLVERLKDRAEPLMGFMDPLCAEAAAEIHRLTADNARLRAALIAAREPHSEMSIAWTRAKQDRARLMAALEKARPYVMIESQRPTILPVVPARSDLAEINALLHALRTAPAEPPVANGGTEG